MRQRRRGEERMMEILGQQQGEEEEEKWKESKRGWSEGDRGADMLSPGVLWELLIHNSPPWQTFIHILTPHGWAQWSSRPSTSHCLSMDTPVVRRSVSPLLFHFGDSWSSQTRLMPLLSVMAVLTPLVFPAGSSDGRLNCVNWILNSDSTLDTDNWYGWISGLVLSAQLLFVWFPQHS